MDIEIFADRHADETAELRYIQAVESYMEELGVSREVAEVLVEREAGSNPDGFYGEVF